MKNTRQVYLPLIPSDFKGNEYHDSGDCAIARAMKRRFKVFSVGVDDESASIWDNPVTRNFTIKDKFTPDDFNFVKAEYEADPNMKKAQYIVTLIPCED